MARLEFLISSIAPQVGVGHPPDLIATWNGLKARPLLVWRLSFFAAAAGEGGLRRQRELGLIGLKIWGRNPPPAWEIAAAAAMAPVAVATWQAAKCDQ